MCGRYALTTPPDVLAALLHLQRLGYAFLPRWNIAPTQRVPVVRADDGGRELVGMHWGLIPSWAKDRSIAARLINARSESAESKPAFRHAFKKRRCLIPASGFYEWKPIEAGGRIHKQPFFIRPRQDVPALFAGLWESWTDHESGEHLDSCTILTTESNHTLREVHTRMPVVLDQSAWNLWLDAKVEDAERLKPLLKAAPDEMFTLHPVSTRVNSSRTDDASLIEPVAIVTLAVETKPDSRRRRGKTESSDGKGLFG